MSDTPNTPQPPPQPGADPKNLAHAEPLSESMKRTSTLARAWAPDVAALEARLTAAEERAAHAEREQAVNSACCDVCEDDGLVDEEPWYCYDCWQAPWQLHGELLRALDPAAAEADDNEEIDSKEATRRGLATLEKMRSALVAAEAALVSPLACVCHYGPGRKCARCEESIAAVKKIREVLGTEKGGKVERMHEAEVNAPPAHVRIGEFYMDTTEGRRRWRCECKVGCLDFYEKCGFCGMANPERAPPAKPTLAALLASPGFEEGVKAAQRKVEAEVAGTIERRKSDAPVQKCDDISCPEHDGPCVKPMSRERMTAAPPAAPDAPTCTCDHSAPSPKEHDGKGCMVGGCECKWSGKPAAPDALGEALALAAEWNKTEDLPPGLCAMLEKARAAHAEDLAAARAEVEGLRKERDEAESKTGEILTQCETARHDLAAALARTEKLESEMACRNELRSQINALRASLAAAQEREGKMREALEGDIARARWALTEYDRKLKEVWGIEENPHAVSYGWTKLLRDDALSQPAPAVPEAAPRQGEVEAVKKLADLARALAECSEFDDKEERADVFSQIAALERAALSAPAKEGK